MLGVFHFKGPTRRILKPTNSWIKNQKKYCHCVIVLCTEPLAWVSCMQARQYVLVNVYRIVASTNTCYYSENQLFVKRSQYIRTKNPLHKQYVKAKTCH